MVAQFFSLQIALIFNIRFYQALTISTNIHLSNSQMFDDFRLAMKSISYLYAAYLQLSQPLQFAIFWQYRFNCLATMFSSDSVKSFIYKVMVTIKSLDWPNTSLASLALISVVSPNSTSININNIVQRCSGHVLCIASLPFIS